MPQFDKITFFNQIFWLIFIFLVFYLFLLKNYLPKISSVIKVRNKKLLKGTVLVGEFSSENSRIFVESNKLASIFLFHKSNQLEKQKEVNFSNVGSFSENIEATSNCIKLYYQYYTKIALKKNLFSL